MSTTTTWFQLGTLGMVLGTLAMVYAMRRAPGEYRRENALLVAVGAIAAVAYALMVFDIGAVTATNGDTVFLTRYVDWLLTTPLHVAYLGLLAGVSKRLLGELVGFQAATIVLGLAGALVAGPLKLVLYLAGCIAFARVLHLLYWQVTATVRSEAERIAGLHRTLLNFIAVLWLVYPVIWILAPAGIGIMDLETTTLVVAYIDVVAKIGFGLIALNGLTAVAVTEANGTDAEVALGD